ncbi:MAG: hypothetical protein KDC28_13940 [Saprospiraceae bacterium]|nr:hypothetical protein [Saprospiraceae bacterium]MCB9319036.1 hypothetical protein [Lewinellaceae bacterium]
MNLILLFYVAFPLLNGIDMDRSGATTQGAVSYESSVYIEVAYGLKYTPQVDIVTLNAANQETFNLINQATLYNWFSNKSAYITSLNNQVTVNSFQPVPGSSRENDLASDQFYARFVFVNAGAQSKNVYVGQATYIEIYIDENGVDVVY